MNPETDFFWNDCDLVHRDPEIVHGTPVLKETRLPADAIVENVESFMEMDGLTVDQAIAETLDCFPGTPGGAGTVPSGRPCVPAMTFTSVNPLMFILDESVPERVAKYLPEHHVKNVREMGIKGIKNGKLLGAVEDSKFEVFISADQHMLCGRFVPSKYRQEPSS